MPLPSASILINMFSILTGFTYRGLAPHKFTPMPGVHQRIQRIAKSVVPFAIAKVPPLFAAADAGIMHTKKGENDDTTNHIRDTRNGNP
jgi:hypothetical protein